MDPRFLKKEEIATLLPMHECITVLAGMFRDLANGKILQPLRSLMWLPDHSGLLGMMPGYAEGPNIIGIKLITIFHGNGPAGYPSHQGVVILFEATHGQPLLLLDAAEITAIRTAAASAVATGQLARQDAETLAIIGTGEQAERHLEAIPLVRDIRRIFLWGRNPAHAAVLQKKWATRCPCPIHIAATAQEAAEAADIICTVTASAQPVIRGSWINAGAHLNIVGSCTPNTREVDTATILRSCLFTDRRESLFNEAGDFLIPKKEGQLDETFLKAEIGEVLTGAAKGRTRPDEITLFKSLGIAAEDLYAAWHIWQQLQ